MSIADKVEVEKLLKDPTLVDDITKRVLGNPAAVEDLADDIADELSDVLEDDPDFKSKIIKAAMANETFKSRLVKKLAEEISD